MSVLGVFEDRGGVQDLLAGGVDIVRDGALRLGLGHFRAAVGDELGDHAEVFVEGVSVRGDGFEVQGSLAREEVFDLLAFALQPAGEDEQPLHLDDADGLLLDVVQFLGGVEDAVGVFLVGAVVAQDEVDLIFPSSLKQAVGVTAL